LLNIVHGGKARIVEGYELLDVGTFIECEVIDLNEKIYCCKVKFVREINVEQY